MFKLIALALGVASASANYAYSWSPFEEKNQYFDMNVGVLADAYYTTTYKGADSHEYNGVKLDSYIDLSVEFEFFEWYKHTISFDFTPIQFVPYTQVVSYDRPIDGGETHATVYGTHSLTLLALNTKHVEQAKTCGASFVDAVAYGDSLAPECGYSSEFKSSYWDAQWKYDAGSMLNIGEWYGTDSWYNKQLF